MTSTPAPDASADQGLEFSVIVADPNGAVVNGTALDVFAVSIHRISKPIGAGDLLAHRADFQHMAEQLIGRPKAMRIAQPWQLGQFGGLDALVLEYGFKIGRQQMVARGYLVPIQDRVYWATAQASTATMDGSDMGVTIDTFRFD